MTSPALPDFVGIGALKAGTTYLDELLRGHPQLSLPRHLKEVDYFTGHYERGPGWYAEQFAAPDGRLRGEISPQYMAAPQCAARVHEANPVARILANLRNPVDRTVSQYRHWIQETGYRGEFDAFLREHPNAVARSRYFEVLQPWVERFGRDHLHLVIFDDLVAEPVATTQAVLRFLGVDDSYVPPDASGASNTSVAPRFPRAYTAAKRIGQRLYRGDRARVVALVKRSGVQHLLKGRAGTQSAQVKQVPAEQRAELARSLRPDVERLSELADRDLVALWYR